MKKFLLWLLTLIITIPAVARDFSYYHNGMTLYYTVIDENAKTCKTRESYVDSKSTPAIVPGNRVSGTVVIPETVTNGGIRYTVVSLGKESFRDCADLTSITLPQTLKTIENGAFLQCINLSSINFPSSIESVGGSAFYGCSSLVSLILPNSIKTIGGGAFSYCSSLSSITLPESISSIGGNAFSNCYALTSISIPETITSIEPYTFYLCKNLSIVELPQTITTIGGYSFCGCDIASLSIPGMVTSIGHCAFYSCTKLEAVIMHNKVQSIGEHVFHNCTNLSSVLLSESLSAIPDYTFYNCKNLRTVNIPSYVTSIGKCAFSSCRNLNSLTIPALVSSIGLGAFEECTNLSKLYCLAQTPPAITGSIFYSVPTATAKLCVRESSVEAYRKAYGWESFTNIIGYYVPGGKNESLYIQDFFIEPGEVAYMPVRVRGERDYTEFSTDIYLPEGLEVVTNEEGYIDVQYACVEDDAHLIFADSQPDGAIRVSVMSFDNAPMIGNGSEELFRLPVRATSSLASKPVPVWMRNTMFKDANYGYLFNDANPHINADGVMGGADVEVSTEAVYYNLQGVRVAQPERGGVYICVQGDKASKIVF